MRRHAFVQSLERERLVERSLRDEWPAPRHGYVLDAPYLRSGPQGSLRSLVARFFGERPRTVWTAPFTDSGSDALGYFTDAAAELSPDDQAEDGVREVRGRVLASGSGARGVLTDLWLGDPPLARVVEMEDFVVVGPDERPVVVTCGLAPIVIAAPCEISREHHLETLEPRTLRLAANLGAGVARARLLTLAAGDEVVVRGVPRPLEASERRVVIEEWASDYRRTSSRPSRVIGDEDGTRLLVRAAPHAPHRCLLLAQARTPAGSGQT